MAFSPFQKTDYRCHWVLRRNRDAHMHMVRHQVSLDDLALLLPSQRIENGTQLPTGLAEYGFPPSFGSWAQEWMELASFTGLSLRNAEERIRRLLALLKEPVPSSWHRDVADMRDRLVDGRRYTRGDVADPRSGEHQIEHEILCEHFHEVMCFGDSKLIDGMNASG